MKYSFNPAFARVFHVELAGWILKSTLLIETRDLGAIETSVDPTDHILCTSCYLQRVDCDVLSDYTMPYGSTSWACTCLLRSTTLDEEKKTMVVQLRCHFTASGGLTQVTAEEILNDPMGDRRAGNRARYGRLT